MRMQEETILVPSTVLVSGEHFSGWEWSLRTCGTGGVSSTLLVVGMGMDKHLKQFSI